MDKWIKLVFFLLLSGISVPHAQVFDSIHDYQASLFFADSLRSDFSFAQQRLCIRLFRWQHQEWMLSVGMEDLRTRLHQVDGWILTPVDTTVSFLGLPQTTLYARALRQAYAQRDSGGGITHVDRMENGIVLSLDLCPSHKALNRRLVEKIWKHAPVEQRPVPMSFAISGEWIREHGNDLDWLKSQVDSGYIKTTWINHSYHHYFHAGIPNQKNFLSLPGVDIPAEVTMLQHGLLPSILSPMESIG